MRLPRRVPWASLAELDQVCAWIYTDENDVDAKALAIQRLSAWRVITTLPHALESTLAILTAIVQDTASSSSASRLHLRQSYASAIIRFVNGFVDPLQLGAYARSIASIAAQLNLPAWLVELRHAATHEDLPSLEVLREAARDAMVWLLHNYFLPSINSSMPPPSQAPPLRPILPLLKQYKSLLKVTTRDASLRSKYKLEITKVLRDIERWIAEAKVAADASATMLEWGIDSDGHDTEEEGREQWALERFCETLLEKGSLVPVSKKKRAVISSLFTPPSGMLSIWMPLIDHIHALHASFPSVLAAKIATHLTTAKTTEEDHAEGSNNLSVGESSQHISYDMCIASWANWLVRTFGTTDDEDDSARLRREDIVIQLANELGPMKQQFAADTKAARILLHTLCIGHSYLERISSVLAPSGPGPSSQWCAKDLTIMEMRLETLLSSRAVDTPTVSGVAEHEVLLIEIGPPLPRGWTLALSEDWKPVPIGV